MAKAGKTLESIFGMVLAAYGVYEQGRYLVHRYHTNQSDYATAKSCTSEVESGTSCDFNGQAALVRVAANEKIAFNSILFVVLGTLFMPGSKEKEKKKDELAPSV